MGIGSEEAERSTAAPLRGRQAQLRSLCTALLGLSGGAPLRYVVSGDTGAGKSRLVGEAIRSADSLGVSVFAGRALELEAGRTFGVILDALGGANHHEPGMDEHARVTRIVGAVKRLCAAAPTLLILEDVQWADRMSLASLSRLLEECRRDALGVLLTLRPFPSNPAVDDLVAQERHSFARVHLEGLEPDDVVQLLYDLVGAVPGPRLRRLATGAGGNPRLVSSLIGCLRSESALFRIGSRVVETDRDLPPRSMWPVVQARVSRVSDRAQDLLTIAAALEQPWDMTSLARAAGRPLAGLIKDMRELVAAGLLSADATQLRFRHDLVRGVLRQAIPAPAHELLAPGSGRAPRPARTASGRPTVAAAPETPSWNTQLTVSEREVVSLVALGLSNKQVAARLSISPRTVEAHLAHVFGKLGVGSRVELAVAVTRSVSATAARGHDALDELRSATA